MTEKDIRNIEASSPRPQIGQDHLFTPPAPLMLTLVDKFLVPPFSVLDARAGYWKDRKQEWLNLGIEPELGNREEDLLGEELGIRSGERAAAGINSGEGRKENLVYGGLGEKYNRQGAGSGQGTSIFDPVLCELAYRWFTPPGGTVLDPFAGGSVRGIVAAALERKYLGIDLSEQQVEANRRQGAALGASRNWAEEGCEPEWVVGDARDVQSLAVGRQFDFIFSCPPYYDLEVYSDDPRDLSKAGSYSEFRAAYYEIICNAAQLLKPNRFAAFVVGEVRAKDGTYCGLVPDTVSCFTTAGLMYYNEAILLTAVGSLPIRTSRTFGPGRKLGKTHQNLLVFVKGDARKAAEACGTALEVALESGGATWHTDGQLDVE